MISTYQQHSISLYHTSCVHYFINQKHYYNLLNTSIKSECQHTSSPLSVNIQCIKRLQLFCLHIYQECAKAHYGMCQRRKTCYSQRGHFNTRDANMAAWNNKGTKNGGVKTFGMSRHSHKIWLRSGQTRPREYLDRSSKRVTAIS